MLEALEGRIRIRVVLESPFDLRGSPFSSKGICFDALCNLDDAVFEEETVVEAEEGIMGCTDGLGIFGVRLLLAVSLESISL